MSEASNLVTELNSQANKNAAAFPGQGNPDYAALFKTLADYLNQHVHPQVEKAAMLENEQTIREVIEQSFSHDVDALKTIERWKVEGIPSAIYLNDHGPKHIEMVIRRASSLIRAMGCKLTPYETYILLVSIHLHDVGNVYGRGRHEQKISDVMNKPEIKNLIDGSTERRFVQRIAGAHGGKIDNDKHTFRTLAESDDNLSYRVRLTYLAAILRFADELSDDRSRAARFLLSEDKILQGSEIYHKYSNSLASVQSMKRGWHSSLS